MLQSKLRNCRDCLATLAMTRRKGLSNDMRCVFAGRFLAVSSLRGCQAGFTGSDGQILCLWLRMTEDEGFAMAGEIPLPVKSNGRIS
jgi:hypothetical protein